MTRSRLVLSIAVGLVVAAGALYVVLSRLAVQPAAERVLFLSGNIEAHESVGAFKAGCGPWPGRCSRS